MLGRERDIVASKQRAWDDERAALQRQHHDLQEALYAAKSAVTVDTAPVAELRQQLRHLEAALATKQAYDR